jgi:hypothetical protein
MATYALLRPLPDGGGGEGGLISAIRPGHRKRHGTTDRPQSSSPRSLDPCLGGGVCGAVTPSLRPENGAVMELADEEAFEAGW